MCLDGLGPVQNQAEALQEGPTVQVLGPRT